MPSEDRESRIAYAQEYGSMWLNAVFRFRDKGIPLFKGRVRVTFLEVVWGVVVALAYGLIAAGLSMLLGDIWMLDVALNPFAILVESVLIGWYGRRLAHTSPLRKQTGEGMNVYVQGILSRAVTRFSNWVSQLEFARRLFRPAMYNICESHFNDKWRTIECVEWLGTQRAPRAPRTTEEHPHAFDSSEIRSAPVTINPRGTPVTEYPSSHYYRKGSRR